MAASADHEDTDVILQPPTVRELDVLLTEHNPKAFNRRRADCGLRFSVMLWPGSMRSFISLKLDRYNFAGLNFQGALFQECSLCSTDFSRANLSGAIFQRCALQDANFSLAELPRARFIPSDLGRANFADARKMPWRLRFRILWQLFMSWR